MKRFVCLLLVICSLIMPAVVLADLEEIVVTGSRLSRYSSDQVPSVTLNRKADFVLINYDFICDTRDARKRKKELVTTLEDLISKAKKRDDIELSTLVEYEDDYDTLYFPIPFEIVDEELIGPQYGRNDTSLIKLIIKTPINDSIDSLEAALDKIEAFIGSVKMTGRSEAVENGDAQLSIVNVERYRSELISEILKNVHAQKGVLGGNSVELSGLENVVRWERTGVLDLKIYIPYKISVQIQ